MNLEAQTQALVQAALQGKCIYPADSLLDANCVFGESRKGFRLISSN